MTKIKPGVVELFVIKHNDGDWRVLVLQRAADGKRPNSWETVYGKVDAREKPEKAAVRELKEETGLNVQQVRFVIVQDCINSSEFYKPAHFVLLNYTCVVEPGEVVLNDEAEEFRWLSHAAALSCTEYGPDLAFSPPI